MNHPSPEPAAACGFAAGKRQVLAEVALVFVVFFIQGATPVPEVNEPYYLGKAIHYWNPDWAWGDFFLETADAHTVFYFTFGWLAIWLPPTVLAWVGRLLTWGLLAWAWQRLSFAAVPRRWYSTLTAGLLVGLIEYFHMAGEWVVGGVEAKGFSFVLVFLGLESLLGNRWNRAWLLLGSASAFHVLVGGWSAVAAAVAWVLLGRKSAAGRGADSTPDSGDGLRIRPTLVSMWPAILGGFLLSLPGLIPSLWINRGADADTVRLANQIYVFGRLGHHLAPTAFPLVFMLRFGLLLVLWLVLGRVTPTGNPMRRLRAFVAAAVIIAAVGMVIGLLAYCDRALAAGLLKFYWFRLADVAVPLGVALGMVSFIVAMLERRPAMGKRWLWITITVAAVHLGSHALQPPVRLATADRLPDYEAWYEACDWVAQGDQIPPDAKFITPLMSQTFKWYTGRSEVANWKEIPQDAASIVQWWRMLEDLYGTGLPPPGKPWHGSLAELGAERLKQLGEKYDADYVITVARPRLELKVMHRNRYYCIYRLSEGR